MRRLICVIAFALSACDSAHNVQQHDATLVVAPHWKIGQPLRVKLDSPRNRVWVLGLDHVHIYDRYTKALIGRIALPGWSVADSLCEPDIAFDWHGTAIISHNVQPRLWEIDGTSLELREHAIRLVGRESLDIGFAKLTFVSDGTLIAADTSSGALWRIDLQNDTAHQVASIGAPASSLRTCSSL